LLRIKASVHLRNKPYPFGDSGCILEEQSGEGTVSFRHARAAKRHAVSTRCPGSVQQDVFWLLSVHFGVSRGLGWADTHHSFGREEAAVLEVPGGHQVGSLAVSTADLDFARWMDGRFALMLCFDRLKDPF
jgi:hypothetical protein